MGSAKSAHFKQNAESLSAHSEETAQQFTERVAPSGPYAPVSATAAHATTITYGKPKLDGTPIATEWNSERVIVAFYRYTVTLSYADAPNDPSTNDQLDGYVYAPDKIGAGYQRIYIGTFEPDGGNPHIDSVFFSNADKDTQTELVVLVSWPQIHPPYYGAFYTVAIYDNLSSLNQGKLTHLSEASKKVNEWIDTKGDNVIKAENVQEELHRLGY